jgi:uncharacterized protein YtpQ (UPF0354 family)
MADRLLTDIEFGIRVLERLKREPMVKAARRQGDRIELTVNHGGPDLQFGFNFENYYRLYLDQPDGLDKIIDSFGAALYTMRDQMPTAQRVPLGTLLPQIKNAQFFKEHGTAGGKLARRPLVADLYVVYVADNPTTMRFIFESDIKHMGWTVDRLHQIALENLAQKAANTNYVMAGEGEKMLIISQTRDSYDAARILLPDLHAHLAEYLPGPTLFGIPNRDFLVTLGDTDKKFVREIAGMVRNDFQSQPQPISPQLFAIVNGKIKVYSGV